MPFGPPIAIAMFIFLCILDEIKKSQAQSKAKDETAPPKRSNKGRRAYDQ